MRMFPVNGESGQSLVQVLVSVAIMGIIMAAVAGMQSSQVKENRALSEKLSALELSRSISQTLAHSAACSALLDAANVTDPSKLTFNSNSVSPSNPHMIPVRSIPSAGGGPVLVRQNSGVSSMAPTLFVPTGGLQVAVTGPLTAELRAGFEQTRLVRAIHDLKFVLNLTTSGPANAKLIDGCQGGDRTPMIEYKIGDFAAMTPTVIMNQPNYRAVSYAIPLASRATDQHLQLSLIGVWDVRSCGGLGFNPCVTSVRIVATVGGQSNTCASNQSVGSSGPYANIVDTSASCVLRIPAGTAASLTVIFDARNGTFVNFNTGTYTSADANANTPILTIFSLP